MQCLSDDDYQRRMKELTEREQCLLEREKRATPCIYPLSANYQSTSFPMLSSFSSNSGAPTQILDSAMNSAQQMPGNSNISSNNFLSMLLSASNPIHGIHNQNVPPNSQQNNNMMFAFLQNELVKSYDAIGRQRTRIFFNNC